MVHLRIVSPVQRTDALLELFDRTDCVVNVIVMRGAARKPEGDVILCDVAREETSVILHDLRAMNLHHEGSIAVEMIDTQLSDLADQAERAAFGPPADAVVWEEVSSRTSESSTLSLSFLMFMVLATLIAAVGITLDSEILIVGAMVVGPEFGPVAGFCVAWVQRRHGMAGRSFAALAVGFPLAIVSAFAVTLAFRGLGVIPGDFPDPGHDLYETFANPDFLAFFVAFCAGVAGMISLTTAKSSALIGVLISVATIPSAANAAVATAYGDWGNLGGSLLQLGINIVALLLGGSLTLYVERLLYQRRLRRHYAAQQEG